MMRQVLHQLFALLASVTRQDLARQVAYLKEGNRILRSKLPKQVVVTEKERNRFSATLARAWCRGIDRILANLATAMLRAPAKSAEHSNARLSSNPDSRGRHPSRSGW